MKSFSVVLKSLIHSILITSKTNRHEKNNILITCRPPLLPTTCVKDEKDLFDLPAAERINAKLQEYSKILQDAPNGWKMEYFPEIKQSMGGYTYFCTFQNGETVMMGDLSLTLAGVDLYPAGTEITSAYKLISDQGPVLSFDSYNPIFHYFSEPKSMIDTDAMPVITNSFL